jgi:asparagine synthase (glutamine-hydrolysing)
MKGIVPDFITNNPIKFGFNSPISDKFHFSDQEKSLASEILLSDKCINRKLFRKEQLIKLLKENESGKRNHSTLLFRLLSVELWFQIFID